MNACPHCLNGVADYDEGRPIACERCTCPECWERLVDGVCRNPKCESAKGAA